MRKLVLQLNAPKETSPSPMIANSEIFNLGGGAKSIMNLKQVGPNRFQFQDGDTEVISQDMDRDKVVDIPHDEDMDHLIKDVNDPSHVDRGPTRQDMLT
ncbi:kinesin motor domain-containing protein, partial [Sesbania bispinosa]